MDVRYAPCPSPLPGGTGMSKPMAVDQTVSTHARLDAWLHQSVVWKVTDCPISLACRVTESVQVPSGCTVVVMPLAEAMPPSVTINPEGSAARTLPEKVYTVPYC